MFSLSALDRPALAQLTKAARMAHGGAFVCFKSATEANALAERCGLSAEIEAQSLRHLMDQSRTCHWCEKSLGKKLTAAFAHLKPLAVGGENTLKNTAVVCQQCARSRVLQQSCYPLHSTGAQKPLRQVPAIALAEPAAEDEKPGLDQAADLFHAGWVYVKPGDQDLPWVFLAWGEAGFADRLQHLKYSAPSGSTEFHVANEPLSSFRGLVVRSSAVAEGMLREVNRAGRVKVLAG